MRKDGDTKKWNEIVEQINESKTTIKKVHQCVSSFTYELNAGFLLIRNADYLWK